MKYVKRAVNCKRIVSLTQPWQDSEIRAFGNVLRDLSVDFKACQIPRIHFWALWLWNKLFI